MMTEDDLTRIRHELERADNVDASRIDVSADGDTVVLRGAVPTTEQATAAQMVAAEHAPGEVRNELFADPNLRESGQGSDPQPHHLYDPPHADSDVPPPSATDFGLTDDVQESLDQNRPLDPPDEPVLAPTPSEQRGYVQTDAHDVAPATPGEEVELREDEEKSAPDLSVSELRRSARPADNDDNRAEG